MPTRHQVLLAESVDEIGTHALIKEGLEEQIGPVDHIDHECLHLLIAEARELGPGDFTGRSLHKDIRVVASLGIGSDSGVEVFQDRVSKALLRHILGQALQDVWILGQEPCAVAIHFRTPRHLSTPGARPVQGVKVKGLVGAGCGDKLPVLRRGSGCGTLLLIASDNPTDAELTELKSFWMWEPVQEGWDYIRDWEEHKRKAIEQHAQLWRTALVKAEEKSGPPTRWIQ
jgi:hypothetical protein